MSNPLFPHTIIEEYQEMASDHAERRRRVMRRKLNDEALKNLITTKKNAELTEKNQILVAELDETKEQLAQVSALARTTLINSVAMKRTIHHLRSRWETASPNCPERGDTEQSLKENIAQFTADIRNDEHLMRGADEKIEQAKEATAAWKKARP